MKITAHDLLERGLIEEIVPEPLGGAHRDLAAMAAILKDTITRNLGELCALPMNELLQARYQRYRAIGESSHARAQAAGVS